MDFADRTLLRLTTSAGRNEILDQTALEQLGETAFDTSLHPLEGPYAIDVAKADFGEEIAPTIGLEGQIVLAPGQSPTDVRLQLRGLQGASRARADLILRATLIARRTFVDDRIEDVRGGFTLLDLDREIEADLGALPANSSALEQERRKRLAQRLKEDAALPGSIGDVVIDSLLASSGSADVGELLDQRGTASLARFALKFKAGAAPVLVPVQLPLTVAALVRNGPLRVRDLLAESRTVQAALAGTPTLQAPAAALRRRAAVPVLWLVPGDEIDNDSDWPGADRPAKRAASAELLGGQGIVLVPS